MSIYRRLRCSSSWTHHGRWPSRSVAAAAGWPPRRRRCEPVRDGPPRGSSGRPAALRSSRFRGGSCAGCRDTELVAPVGSLNREALTPRSIPTRGRLDADRPRVVFCGGRPPFGCARSIVSSSDGGATAPLAALLGRPRAGRHRGRRPSRRSASRSVPERGASCAASPAVAGASIATRRTPTTLPWHCARWPHGGADVRAVGARNRGRRAGCARRCPPAASSIRSEPTRIVGTPCDCRALSDSPWRRWSAMPARPRGLAEMTGTSLEVTLFDPSGELPKANSGVANLFVGDESSESDGLLTKPIGERGDPTSSPPARGAICCASGCRITATGCSPTSRGGSLRWRCRRTTRRAPQDAGRCRSPVAGRGSARPDRRRPRRGGRGCLALGAPAMLVEGRLRRSPS